MNKWILLKTLISLLLIYYINDLYKLIKDLKENKAERKDNLPAHTLPITTLGLIVMLIVLLYGFPNK